MSRGSPACWASMNVGSYRLAHRSSITDTSVSIVCWKGGVAPPLIMLPLGCEKEGVLITMYTCVTSPLYLPCLKARGERA